MKQKTWTTYNFILRMHGEILYLIWCAKYESHNTIQNIFNGWIIKFQVKMPGIILPTYLITY